MTLPIDKTKVLIDRILEATPGEAREVLRFRLEEMKSTEPELYWSVVLHSPGLTYIAEQWFDLLSKIPTRALRDEQKLMDKLSEAQRERLPPALVD